MPGTFPAAVSFYHSPRWRRAAEAYRKAKGYLCERCHQPASTVHHKVRLTPANIDNPDVSLNPANFELLCNDCHNAEHERCQRTKPEPRRIRFDADGNVIEAARAADTGNHAMQDTPQG